MSQPDSLEAAGHHPDERRSVPSPRRRLFPAGCPLDLFGTGDILRAVDSTLERRDGPALVVSSVNLDHLRHFAGDDDQYRAAWTSPQGTPGVRWVHIADGWPISWWGQRRAKQDWPLLPGSDLLPLVLEIFEHRCSRIGILGGFEETHERFRAHLAAHYPNIELALAVGPERADLASPVRMEALSERIRDASLDILLVSLGKPRQEKWLIDHASRAGARIYLPFGAATEFLAGSVPRAPVWMRRVRLEWLHRLILDPRRLARRYLREAPTMFVKMLRSE